MKRFYFVLFAAVLCWGAASCGDETTVSVEMPYKAGYVLDETSTVMSSGSDCAALHDALIRLIGDYRAKYNKTWTLAVSGSSLDEACAAADKEALGQYDDAVRDLQSIRTTLDEMIAAKDYGKGSFTLTCHYEVSRDKVLRKSEPVTFSYPKK